MGGRVVIRLKYVHAFRDRAGRMRYYFRRHGKRTPLPGLPGSGEFMDAYATLLSIRLQHVEPRPTAAPKTFAALAIRYYGSPQYRSLSASSRTNYRRVIDGFLEGHGHRRVDQMTREHVDIVIGKMANKPGAGIILLKRVRTLIRYAMALGWTDRDPTAGVKGYKSKEIHTWNEGEISVFERRWPEGTRERLTFALLLYTGQRGSDVYRMTWTDIVGDAIRVAQQKTAAKLTIPIHGALYRVLSTANRSHPTILVTAYGEQFSVKGFGHMISTAIREAGLPERCKAHGLRKAAARRLAEAGCSASEIAAITGHKTLAEVERYTRAADQERLARQAIKRQSESRSGNPLADEVANTTDEALKINSLLWKMVLPREVCESNDFNALPRSLGKTCFIDLHGVSAWFPKPFCRTTGRPLSGPDGRTVGDQPTTSGKWLELLKEIAPNIKRAGLLFNPKTAPFADYWLRPFDAAAKSLGIEPVVAHVDVETDLETVFAAEAQSPDGGLVVMPDGFLNVYRELIVALASRYSVPTVYPWRFFPELGSLMSYGFDQRESFRTAAVYVDRILKGEKPADLPVQAPTKYELVINRKAAKALGLSVPMSLLGRADDLIN